VLARCASAESLYVTPPEASAKSRCFVTVKLQQIRLHLVDHTANQAGLGVDKQCRQANKSRHSPTQPGRVIRADETGAGLVKHHADGIDASRNRSTRILLARQATGLDARAQACCTGYGPLPVFCCPVLFHDSTVFNMFWL